MEPGSLAKTIEGAHKNAHMELQKILEHDDEKAFKVWWMAWLSSIENRPSIKNVKELSIHVIDKNNTNVAHSVIGSMFELKAYKCFGVFIGDEGERSQLTVDKVFKTLREKLPEIEMYEDQYHSFYSGISFMDKLLDSSEKEMETWLIINKKFWKKFLSTNDSSSTNPLDEVFDATKIFQTIGRGNIRHSGFLIAAYNVGLIDCNLAISMYELTQIDTYFGKDFFKEDSMGQILKIELLKAHDIKETKNSSISAL